MFPNACRDENKVIWEEILTSLDWIECVCVCGGGVAGCGDRKHWALREKV